MMRGASSADIEEETCIGSKRFMGLDEAMSNDKVMNIWLV